MLIATKVPAAAVGDVVIVEPLARVNEARWTGRCGDIPEGWNCVIVSRNEEELTPGKQTACWVLDVYSDLRTVEVTDSSFGFLPISDRMRPRYVSALRRVASIVGGGAAPNESDAEAFSEVKGMYNRCARRDQWDWHAVHSALGMPPRADCRDVADILYDLGRALREHVGREDFDKVLKSLPIGFAAAAKNAAASILEQRPRLQEARTYAHADHEVRAQPSRSAVVSTYSKEKLDKARASHAHVLHVLAQELTKVGLVVEANRFVDAFVRLKSGPAIFEAKSLSGENELSQVRDGIGQLYEYRYRHEMPNASLWLILSSRPNLEWLIDYLEKDRGILLLWLRGEELEGPSLHLLTESGRSARRRTRSK